jgi:hypothetical protein
MSIPRPRTIGPGLFAALLAAVVAAVMANRGFAAPAGPDAAVDRKQMEAWWADLEKEDAEASRALLELYDRKAAAVPFLKDKMKPLRISSARVKALLLKLNSANENLWKTAFEELEYFDPRLAIELTELMDRVTESPVRQRMVEILSERDAGSLNGHEIELRPVGEGFNFFNPQIGSWWAEPKVSRINNTRWGNTKRKWTRAERAIILLEHLGNPEARSILKEMATGHPEARPTIVAKEALARAAEAHTPTEDCWANLEKGEVEASRALLELYDRPQEAVPLLMERMKPLAITSVQVKALLFKLSNGDEHVWKPAFDEMEYYDPRLAIGLEELMDQVTQSPARQRMVAVLSERDPASLEGRSITLWRGAGFFNFNSERGSWWADDKVSEINARSWGTIKRKWTRAERAIVLLEHVRSHPAISILKNMATGHPDARPTKVAKEALKRVDSAASGDRH